MTIIAGLLIGALIVQQILHRRQLDFMAKLAVKERSVLADRIQHPELRQVQSLPPEEHEPPRDAAWMALVGQVYDGPLPEED
jgi:hypothetical protein